MPLRYFVLSLALTLLSACSSVPQTPVAVEDTTSPRWKISEAAPAGKVRIDISLASSTAQLLTGEGSVLAEMDVSPGVSGHLTPAGKYRVTEKLALKRSNLYGQYVRPDTREVVVARAWEHKGPRPDGTVYQGIAMPFWLRVTSDGVGIHVGGFSRGQPSSHGCVRCPEEPQRFFWEKCRVGTPVHIHHGEHPAPSLLNPPPLVSGEPSAESRTAS